MVINTPLGIGDAFYVLPILKAIVAKYPEVYVRTCWPQILNLNCKYLRPSVGPRLKIQAKAVKGNEYSQEPGGKEIYLRYDNQVGVNHIKAMYDSVKSLEISEDYFLDAGLPDILREDFVVVRPALNRRDCHLQARNCKQEYIQHCINRCRESGLRTIIIANVTDRIEEYDEFRPDADIYYERGERSIYEIMVLVRRCKFAVGAMGMMMGMCVALNTNYVCILGGVGGREHPDIIRKPGKCETTFVLPDNMCMCTDYRHNCNKSISLERIDSCLKQFL
jgi:hypothetical protein